MLFLNKTHPNRFFCFVLSLVLVGGCFSPLCNASWAVAGNNELNFKVYNADSTASPTAVKNVGTDTGFVEETPVNDSSTQSGNDETSLSQLGDGGKEQSGADQQIVDKLKPKAVVADPLLSKDATAELDKAAGTGNEGQTANKQIEDASSQLSDNASSTDNAPSAGSNKVLQGYVRVVPTGTKIPIIMDTAVDSDTSQEGDEFSARTAEDLTIDGTTAIPAGSIIRGRIATLNAPKHLNRSGSVALRFDTVTTPDNRQIPLVANLVARGGVVHARRGLKDIAIDTATFSVPTVVALGIGAVAGHSSSSVGTAGGALIGAGVGAAVGLAILLAKKGKRVDVRPGDELKIELAEDLHMPTM